MKRAVTGATVVASVALCAFAWQSVVNVNVLVAERTEVKAQVARTLGVQLSVQQADELIDGGRPEVSLPNRAAKLGLTSACQTLRLVPLQQLVAHATVPAQDYGIELSGIPLLGHGDGSERATPCIAPSVAAA